VVLTGVFAPNDRAAHEKAGHYIHSAVIYQFGATFQVCSCGQTVPA